MTASLAFGLVFVALGLGLVATGLIIFRNRAVTAHMVTDRQQIRRRVGLKPLDPERTVRQTRTAALIVFIGGGVIFIGLGIAILVRVP